MRDPDHIREIAYAPCASAQLRLPEISGAGLRYLPGPGADLQEALLHYSRRAGETLSRPNGQDRAQDKDYAQIKAPGQRAKLEQLPAEGLENTMKILRLSPTFGETLSRRERE